MRFGAAELAVVKIRPIRQFNIRSQNEITRTFTINKRICTNKTR